MHVSIDTQEGSETQRTRERGGARAYDTLARPHPPEGYGRVGYGSGEVGIGPATLGGGQGTSGPVGRQSADSESRGASYRSEGEKERGARESVRERESREKQRAERADSQGETTRGRRTIERPTLSPPPLSAGLPARAERGRTLAGRPRPFLRYGRDGQGQPEEGVEEKDLEASDDWEDGYGRGR